MAKNFQVMTIVVDLNTKDVHITSSNIGGDPLYRRNEVEFLKKVTSHVEASSKELEKESRPKQGWEYS